MRRTQRRLPTWLTLLSMTLLPAPVLAQAIVPQVGETQVHEPRVDETGRGETPALEEDASIPDSEKSQEPLLSPEAARRSFRVPAGFVVSVFAAEPDLRQPIAIYSSARAIDLPSSV